MGSDPLSDGLSELLLLDPDALADMNIDPAGSACGLPVAVQIDRVRAACAAAGVEPPVIEITDLLDLTEQERAVALDAMCAGEPSPVVIVGDRLVCAGSVDTAAVMAALGL